MSWAKHLGLIATAPPQPFHTHTCEVRWLLARRIELLGPRPRGMVDRILVANFTVGLDRKVHLN